MLKPIASILIFATSPVFAVDLTKAKLPLHYECKASEGAGIWKEVSGELRTGKFIVSPNDRSTLVLERFSETSSRRFPRCKEDRKVTFSSAMQSEQFCLTRIIPAVGRRDFEETTFCDLAEGAVSRGAIYCRQMRLLFDADKEILVMSESVEFLVLGGSSAGIFKHDCKPLDR